MVLNGGHSGKDINKNHGNPITALGYILTKINSKNKINLNFIDGGTWVTAIPRKAGCIITSSPINDNELKEFFSKFQEQLQDRFKNPSISVKYTQIPTKNLAFSNKDSLSIIDYISKFPSGPILTHKNNSESLLSANLGTVFFDDKGNLLLENSIRSNISPELTEQFIDKLKNIESSKYNLSTEEIFDFPGYFQEKDTPFIKYLIKKYNKVFGNDPIVKDEHFMLECAWFSQKIPDLQYVSISPNIENPHSPYERVSISSMEKMWEFIQEVSKDLGKDKNLEKKGDERDI